MSGREAHQLRCCHRVVVDFSAKDRLETSLLGGPRDILYLGRPPPRAWNDADSQPFRHVSPHSGFRRLISRLPTKFYSTAFRWASTGRPMATTTTSPTMMQRPRNRRPNLRRLAKLAAWDVVFAADTC